MGASPCPLPIARMREQRSFVGLSIRDPARLCGVLGGVLVGLPRRRVIGAFRYTKGAYRELPSSRLRHQPTRRIDSPTAFLEIPLIYVLRERHDDFSVMITYCAFCAVPPGC